VGVGLSNPLCGCIRDTRVPTRRVLSSSQSSSVSSSNRSVHMYHSTSFSYEVYERPYSSRSTPTDHNTASCEKNTFYPEEISSMVRVKIKEIAKANLGETH